VTDNPLHPINNPLSPLYAFNSIHAQLAAQDARGIRDVGPLSSDMSAFLERWSVTDNFSLEISPNLTFRSIVNYQNARYARTVDGDGTILPVFDPVQSQSVPFDTTQYSVETQLQLSDLFGGAVDGIFGLFYLESPEADDFSSHINATLGRRKVVGIRNSESSRAVFGQVDVDLASLLDGLSLTAGLRYTWDSIYRSQREVNIPAGTCVSAFAGPDCVSVRSGDFEAPTWTLGLNYEVSPDTLLYVATRRGYRSGGFNLDGETPIERVAFDSETVTDVEVGLKMDWLLGSVSGRTNVAAYHQWYTDIQLSQTVPSVIPGGTLTYIVNGGEAEITGLEIEQRLYFGDRFEIGAQTSLIDFEYTEINPGVNLPVIPTVADYTYGIDAAVHLMTSATMGDITMRASWNVTGGRYTASLTDPNAYQDEFGLLTLGADWRNVGGRPIDLTFFMTNATDEEFQVGSLPLTGSLGVATIAYGEPRMWGLRLGYRFGANAY
jgi:iron complex outermembrane receptor protein